MNVSLEKKGAASIIKLELLKADYAENMEKALHAMRKDANMPGFRKGKVPMGMIKKMYGTRTKIDEINKLVSENLNKYIQDEKLNILGQPIPNETDEKEMDFEKDDDFEFLFDVALSPTLKEGLGSDITLPYYSVLISDELVQSQIDNMRATNGTMNTDIEVAEENDILKGLMTELENGSPKADGLSIEGAIMMPKYMKGNEDEKAKFKDAKKNSVIVFNPMTAFGSEAEVASLMKIEHDDVKNHTGDFSFEIQEISRNEKAEMNQEFFDKILGEGKVSNEEEFINAMRENYKSNFQPQADNKFLADAKDVLIEQAGDVELADDVLKRWLLLANEKSTKEEIENSYSDIRKDLIYQLIQETLLKEANVKLENEDIQAYAARVAQAQFAQYGMLNVPEEQIKSYALEMLKNEETQRNIVSRVMEQKLSAILRDKATLDIKEITPEDFQKMFAPEEEATEENKETIKEEA